MARAKKPAAAEWVDPGKLVPWRRNPRRLTEEDVLRVMRSIERFGFGAPIVARRRDNAVVAGHARREAALRLGFARVPVRYLERDLSDDEIETLLVADNRIGELRAWDEATLRELLDGLDDDLRDLACFDEAALDALVEAVDGDVDDQAEAPLAPPPAPQAVSQRGDLWLLGPHRLLCGDSTNEEDVARVLADVEVRCVWTDPPYGVAYGDKNRHLNRYAKGNRVERDIASDASGEDARAIVFAAFAVARKVSPPGCPVYVAVPPGPQGLQFVQTLGDAGITVRQVLVWVKSCMVIGRSDYHYRHELLLYGWLEGAGHWWYGGRDKQSVLEFARPRANTSHPTMKPVELIEASM